MRQAKILHNPNAGKEEYSKKELVSIVESQGFEPGYASVKEKGWKKLKPDTDFLIVAGGDGTVRRVAVKLLDKLNSKKSLPIALLPLGTANNIAKSLGITGHAKEIISNLDKDKRQKYDVGRIKGMKCAKMFLESFGFGVFPELMKSMKEQADTETGTPEEELKLALELLHRIILNHTLQRFHISVDGTEQTGKYLLAEVMNIASLGPNLRLNADADPGDGKFEVVLIPENMRTEFADYVSNMINGTEKEFTPLIIRGKSIIISTDSKLVHIDDQLKELKKPSTVMITPEAGKLEFLIPNGAEN